MEQPNSGDDLIRGISGDRLAPYLTRTGQGLTEALAIYAWNVALCESLYPVLHGIEITLRNSIHDAASQQFMDPYWFRTQVLEREQVTVSRTAQRLDRNGRSASPGRFVADLSFGFWISLFDSRYDGILWPDLLRPVFPTTPRSQRSYKTILRRLEEVRRLRNRVFHHEPVWHWQDLGQQHHNILETIGWMNRGMKEFVESLDRFPEIHSRNPQL